MSIVAQAIQHEKKAEILIKKSDRLLKKLEERKQGDFDQMMTDLASISAMSALATAHTAMAQYLDV